MKKSLPFLFLLFFCVSSFAAAGRNVAILLDFPTSARATAMANTGAAIADDAASCYINPAAFGYIPKAYELSFTQEFGTEGSAYGYYGFLNPIFNFSVLSFDAGSMDVLELNQNPYSVNAQRDFVGSGGWGTNISQTCFVGANIKYVSSTLATTYNASTVSGDLGFLYRTIDDKLSLGAVARNFSFSSFKYYSQKEMLPTELLIGSAYRVNFPHSNTLLLSADFSHNDMELRLGAEYKFMRLLALRAGYAVSSQNSFTFGFGLIANAQNTLRVDYGINMSLLNALDSGHTISISYRFGQENATMEIAKNYSYKMMRERSLLWDKIAWRCDESNPLTYIDALASMNAPIITGYFPKAAKPGERVQLIGANFASDVVVLFDGIEAKVTMLEKDVLTVEVPQELQEGDIKLFVSAANLTSTMLPFHIIGLSPTQIQSPEILPTQSEPEKQPITAPENQPVIEPN